MLKVNSVCILGFVVQLGLSLRTSGTQSNELVAQIIIYN